MGAVGLETLVKFQNVDGRKIEGGKADMGGKNLPVRSTGGDKKTQDVAEK